MIESGVALLPRILGEDEAVERRSQPVIVAVRGQSDVQLLSFEDKRYQERQRNGA